MSFYKAAKGYVFKRSREKEKIIMKDNKKLTRETIKRMMEDFFTEHEKKELKTLGQKGTL